MGEKDTELLDAELNGGVPASDNPAANDTPAASDPKPNDEHGDFDEGDEVRGRVDEELDGAVDEAAREAIRERRRVEKRDRVARRREREATNQRRLDELTAQNHALQMQIQAINGNLMGTQLTQHQTHADAISAGDGQGAAAALDNMQKAQRAEVYYEQLVVQAQRPQPRASNPGGAPTPQLNSQMVSRATAFMAEHTWYRGHTSTEPDSAVMTAIDSALAKEGWDPAAAEYWDELAARARRYLPHRFNKAPAPKPGYNSGQGNSRPQVTAGAGGQSAGGRSSGGYELSAARVAALKEAGQWDDPVKRKAGIDSYRAYDAQNRS
jgi:hypothetical protein